MNPARNIIIDNASVEPQARQERASWYTPGLSDGLGDRLLMFDNTSASALELLRFKREFGENEVFAEAVRARIAEVSGFNHPCVAKVRTVDWLGAGEGFALISNQTPGRRLSEVLHNGRGPGFAMELIRQLTPVLVSLHHHGEGIVHGALTTERVVVTPDGRLVILEHVLGSALESPRALGPSAPIGAGDSRPARRRIRAARSADGCGAAGVRGAVAVARPADQSR